MTPKSDIVEAVTLCFDIFFAKKEFLAKPFLNIPMNNVCFLASFHSHSNVLLASLYSKDELAKFRYYEGIRPLILL